MALCFSFFLLLFVRLFASATGYHRNLAGVTDASLLSAEQLIRSFNLNPRQGINMPVDEVDSASDVRIVEKPIRLIAGGTSGPSIQEFGHYAGYYRLPETKGARMFYFFFESRSSKTDPVVIWLTGGPGCGSELALFYENGPVKLSPEMSLVWNEYGWDTASNILFVDQPTGTGFSFSTDKSDFRHNETEISNDLYNFLQEFFKVHREFVNHDFYITGESYAGHYIPALASRINRGNKNKEGIRIHLKGFAIGNGMTNPGIQYKAYTDFALANKLINRTDYARINRLIPGCEEQMKICETDGGDVCKLALIVCNQIFAEILKLNHQINYYDIRKKCNGGGLCYDFSDLETLLNNDTVKKALGVGAIEWVSCSEEVYDAMVGDWMQNLEVGIPSLLEQGIKVLIYAGEEDLICNWIGNLRWVRSTHWSGQKAFKAAPKIPFMVDGSKAGEITGYGPLTFLKLHDAGHMVPMDQPKAALEMLKRWTKGALEVA